MTGVREILGKGWKEQGLKCAGGEQNRVLHLLERGLTRLQFFLS